MRRFGTLAAAATLLVLPACQLVGGDSEGAEDAAEKLASGLSEDRLDQVPGVAAADADAYAGIIEQLAQLPHEVEVAEVDADDGSATATLTWTWELPDDTWTYDTEATLSDDGGWQVEWDPALVEPSLTEGEHLALTTVPADRGDILGAGNAPIVTERPVVRYGLDKTKVKAARVAASAGRIADLLDIDRGDYVKRAKASGPDAFVEALVLRAHVARSDVPPEYGDVPGAVAIDDTMPLAPTREFAAALLGSVGEATAEVIKESDGEIQAGDVVGLSGLQQRYDEQLRGRAGVRIEATGGDEERTLFEADPVEGEPLRLTLDPDLQRKAEAVLADVGSASGIVAIDPRSGDILAAASGPGSKGLNTATYGQYPPGSTMKVVSSLALLRSGMSPQSPISCPASTVVDGKRFENYDDYPPGSLGRITLREAVAESCNTAFVGSYDRLGRKDLTEAAAALGMGVDHDLGFPAYFGQVPPPKSDTEQAADMIGQGKVLASPMVMATVAASVRSGETVLPRLVKGYDVDQNAPAEPLTGTEARQLRGLMRAVVTDGPGSFLLDVPGEVGAKTGTAEYGTPRPDGSLPTHAWMIGARDDLAVAVFVAKGDSGSGTAGPLLEQMLRR